VRAVHHLAGGNPRVYTLFAQFMTRESLDDLVDAFMKMLDDLTPYYQARMKELSNQQRKIVELLIDRRQAVMVKDIGDACFIDQRAVASQLRELKKKGYVVSNEVGRESGYELREVLMRFCMEVKKFRGRWVELIVDFLKVWYRPDQRLKLLEQFGDSKLMSRDDLEQALLSSDDRLGAICIRQFEKSLQEENQSVALQIAEKLYSVDIITHDEYKEISIWINDQKYQEALNSLEIMKSIESEDTYLELYLQLLVNGLKLQKEKKWKESIEFYDKALNTIPKSYSYKVWHKRGESLWYLGEYEMSLASIDIAIEIKPDSYGTWYNRGVCLSRLERNEEAIISYNQAIEIKPDFYDAWYNQGVCLSRLKRYEEAIKSYSQAIKIKPDLHDAWYNQGNSLFRLGQYAKAIESYDHAVAIKPDKHQAWFSRGTALRKLERYEETLVSYDRAVTITPDEYYYSYSKGFIYFATSNYQLALTTWQQFLPIINNLDKKSAYDVSGLIQEFVEELIPRFTQPSLQQTLLIPLLTIYKDANVITELGAALVNTLHLIVAPTISDHTAAEWLSLWRTSSLGNEPAMELPLRLMNTAIEYKKDPSKRQRLWLNLPSEERPILDKALKLAD
jgi:tetratricopeptide (TPR) repeat protein